MNLNPNEKINCSSTAFLCLTLGAVKSLAGFPFWFINYLVTSSIIQISISRKSRVYFLCLLCGPATFFVGMIPLGSFPSKYFGEFFVLHHRCKSRWVHWGSIFLKGESEIKKCNIVCNCQCQEIRHFMAGEKGANWSSADNCGVNE